ncbi:hypothetical protein D3C76_660020 [compost metagenome]
MVEAERRADGQHPFANLELVGVAELQSRQVLRFDLQQCHVAARIGADQFGLVLTAIGKTHENLVGIGDHMVVGQHVAIVRDDETGTQRLSLTLTTAGTAALIAGNAALEEIAEHRRQAFEVGNRQLPAPHRLV